MKTPSMKIALEDLKLDHLSIVYPGKEAYDFTEKISVVGIESPTFIKAGPKVESA